MDASALSSSFWSSIPGYQGGQSFRVSSATRPYASPTTQPLLADSTTSLPSAYASNGAQNALLNRGRAVNLLA
jgi:hypothetical protein